MMSLACRSSSPIFAPRSATVRRHPEGGSPSNPASTHTTAISSSATAARPPTTTPVCLPDERGANGLRSGVDDGLGERVRTDMIVDGCVVQFGQCPADPHAKLVLKIEIGSGCREPHQLRDHGLGRRRGEERSALVQLSPVLGEPRHRGGQVLLRVARSATRWVGLRPGLSARPAGLLTLPRYRHRDRVGQRAADERTASRPWSSGCRPSRLAAQNGTATPASPNRSVEQTRRLPAAEAARMIELNPMIINVQASAVDG